MEIRIEAAQFVFWEDLFKIFDIVSLQCMHAYCLLSNNKKNWIEQMKNKGCVLLYLPETI